MMVHMRLTRRGYIVLYSTAFFVGYFLCPMLEFWWMKL